MTLWALTLASDWSTRAMPVGTECQTAPGLVGPILLCLRGTFEHLSDWQEAMNDQFQPVDCWMRKSG